MQTKIEAYKVVLRGDAIRKAVVKAAIEEEGHNQMRATSEFDLQSWWFEEGSKIPSELTVYLVDKLPEENKKLPRSVCT